MKFNIYFNNVSKYESLLKLLVYERTFCDNYKKWLKNKCLLFSSMIPNMKKLPFK